MTIDLEKLNEDRTASFDEVLEFANAVREAGGANPIDALMPSEPQNSERCLIARNLNFSCEVDCNDGAWTMAVADHEIRDRIASTLGLDLVGVNDGEYDDYRDIELPTAIGNVAHDFDQWQNGKPGDEYEAFTQYVESAESYSRSELAQEQY